MFAEIKQQLYAEHKRDVRITIIRNSLIIALILIIAALIYYFAFSQAVDYFKGITDFFDAEKNPSANTYKLIALFVAITGIGYFVYGIVKQTKRPKEIEEFMSKIEAGKVASNIVEETIYKIIIPLLKFRLKLSPVTYVNVTFSQEYKNYKLPINDAYIHDLKIALSGVSSADVGKAWDELYDGETTAAKAETSELKSTETFKDFVNTELAKEIENVENKRKKGKSQYLKYLIPSIFVLVAWIVFNFFMSSGKVQINSQVLIIVFIAAALLLPLILSISRSLSKKKPVGTDFQTQFKTQIFNRLIHFINPNFKYIMQGHISLPEFLEMGFFRNANYHLTGNDQIIGKHSGVPFQMCDLQATGQRKIHRENESPDDVFDGQIFIAKFNKSFNGEVYIIPKKLDGKFIIPKKMKDNFLMPTQGGNLMVSSNTGLYLDDLGQKVELEDPEFMKMFKVYATDQLEARYILSTSMMQRIKDMAKADAEGKFMISFRNNRISIANNSHRNNFEISMFKSVEKNKVVEFYEELCSNLKMIDDLKLNINIWKK